MFNLHIPSLVCLPSLIRNIPWGEGQGHVKAFRGGPPPLSFWYPLFMVLNGMIFEVQMMNTQNLPLFWQNSRHAPVPSLPFFRWYKVLARNVILSSVFQGRSYKNYIYKFLSVVIQSLAKAEKFCFRMTFFLGAALWITMS